MLNLLLTSTPVRMLKIAFYSCTNQINYPLFRPPLCYLNGKNNSVRLGKLRFSSRIEIYINGKNCLIEIAPDCFIDGNLKLWCEGDESKILIGKNVRFFGDAQIAALEGTTVELSEDILLGPNVDIRSGDSHEIFDRAERRINPSVSILIGKHCWIAKDVTILKGVTIPCGCIIGAKSLVTKSPDEANSLIAGTPAKSIRTSISWK